MLSGFPVGQIHEKSDLQHEFLLSKISGTITHNELINYLILLPPNPSPSVLRRSFIFPPLAGWD
jgi:hypothetical protein